MTTLPNYPMVNQLGEVSADGYPVNNAAYDCVPCSFASAIEYFTGEHVTGQELKDAEYGATYANSGTALWRYVDNATDVAREVYHITATAKNGTTGAALVALVHQLVQAGYPVIATIPSAWGTAHPQAELNNPGFSTHVIAFFGEANGSLTAMNPWRGFVQTQPDLWWEQRLCYAQVWQVYREAGAMLQLAQAASFFKAGANGAWQCLKNSHTIHGAILQHYQSFGGNYLFGLTYLGLPLTEEIVVSSTYNGRIQVFERGAIAYDPLRKWDAPPGVPSADSCYMAHIDNGTVHTWLLSALNSQLASVQAQLTAMQGQDATDKTTIANLQAEVAQLNSDIAALKAAPTPPDAQSALDLITADLKAAGKL